MITTAPSLELIAQSFDSIEYAEAVEQRVILQDPHRQILLVRLQVGICLFRQTAPQDGFIQVIAGRGILVLEGQRVVLEPGGLIALPAHTVHSIHAVSNLAFLKVTGAHQSCEEALAAQ